MSLANILTWSYWFSQPFTAKGGVFWVFVWGFLILVLAGLVAKIVRTNQKEKALKEILRRAGNCGVVMGLLGLLWLFFRQEQVAFLAWRFWGIFWLGILVYWIYRIIHWAVVRVPVIKAEEAKRGEMNKYLPKK